MSQGQHVSYEEFPGFEHIYLEDSYVLDIQQDMSSLRFDLDLVLTPGHALYRPPRRGEQYCYMYGAVEFLAADRIEWTKLSLRYSRDASDEIDFGNIDSLYRDGNHFHVAGDWGSVTVNASSVRLVVYEADEPAEGDLLPQPVP